MKQVCVIVGLVAGLGVVGLQAAKPVYHTWGTSATFRSAVGDGVHADTEGAYVRTVLRVHVTG